MARLTMRLAEWDGTTLIDLMPETFTKAGSGVYMSTYSLGSPEVREVVQDAPQRNGTYDLTALFGSRQFTAEVKVFDTLTKTRHQVADFLRGLCRPDRRLYVYIKQDGWTSERRMLLRGQPVASVVTSQGGIYVEMSLAWNCPTGVIESSLLSSSAGTADTLRLGKTFPLTFPFSITPGGDTGGGSVLTNSGNVPVLPVLRVNGPCKDLEINNYTTKKKMKLLGITVASGHYLDIDTAARTVYMDSTPTSSFYGKIDWSVSQWLDLVPGENRVALSATGQNSNTNLEVRFRSAWL